MITEAMQIMDHVEAINPSVPLAAEQLARKCYQEQGLSVDEATFRQVARLMMPKKEGHREPAQGVAPKTIKEKRSSFLPPIKWLEITLGALLGVAVIIVFKTMFFALTPSLPQFLQGHLSSPPSAKTVVNDVRIAIASENTNQFQAWMTKDNSGKAIQSMGKAMVVNREGRPELQWSGVSAEVCHAMVVDIYDEPSRSGVAAFIDGKSTGFSCAGPNHQILLTPHL